MQGSGVLAGLNQAATDLVVQIGRTGDLAVFVSQAQFANELAKGEFARLAVLQVKLHVFGKGQTFADDRQIGLGRLFLQFGKQRMQNRKQQTFLAQARKGTGIFQRGR